MKFFKMLIMGFLATPFAFSDAFAAVPAGWQQIKPGGETLCSRGTPFSFLVKRGDPQKVVVSFAGGGACWDEETCDTELVYFTTAEKTFNQVDNKTGIFDHANKDNPYKGWTHVFVPYCTGDVHVGSSDTTYTRPDKTTFVIHHRGAINSKSVLKWVEENYKTVQQFNLNGCSAGSYGSIIWTPEIAEHYPQARIVQFGDSGAGVSDSLFLPQWRLDLSLPAWVPGLNPALVSWQTLSIVDIYKAVANYYPQARLSQMNHQKDRIQTMYYAAMGGNGLDWSSRMFNNMQATSQGAANFRYYVAPGINHCSLNKDPFYTKNVDGVSLKDWLSREISGQDVENVKCKECGVR